MPRARALRDGLPVQEEAPLAQPLALEQSLAPRLLAAIAGGLTLNAPPSPAGYFSLHRHRRRVISHRAAIASGLFLTAPPPPAGSFSSRRHRQRVTSHRAAIAGGLFLIAPPSPAGYFSLTRARAGARRHAAGMCTSALPRRPHNDVQSRCARETQSVHVTRPAPAGPGLGGWADSPTRPCRTLDTTAGCTLNRQHCMSLLSFNYSAAERFE